MAKVHHENACAVGKKIFFGHLNSIMAQALLQKYDILDCVTVIDLSQAPPTVKVKLASSFLAERGVQGHYLEQLKRVVEQSRQNGSLTVAITARGSNFNDANGLLIVESFSATYIVPSGSWKTMQTDMARANPGQLNRLLSDSNKLEKELQRLRIAGNGID